MTTLGDSMVKALFGQTEAEKTFRPWWDNLEDVLLYGLIILALILYPTSIVSNAPLECTICKEKNCNFETMPSSYVPYNGTDAAGPYNIWWVKKYCTFHGKTGVEEFILYFPYILLIVPLLMILIENCFIRLFHSSDKVELLYNLLVKDILPKKCGDSMENATCLEKRIIEISNSFTEESNLSISYHLQTITKLIMTSGLLSWIIYRTAKIATKGSNVGSVICEVYDYWYECTGHPQMLYVYCAILASILLVTHIILNILNLGWLIFPNIGNMSSAMEIYKNECTKKNKNEFDCEEKRAGLDKYYFKNRDFKLLLDLLATNYGTMTSLRLLAMVDKGFGEKFKPSDLKFAQPHYHERKTEINIANEEGVKERVDETKVYDIDLSFEDAPAMDELIKYLKGCTCLYSVEVIPPTPSFTVDEIKVEEFSKKGEKKSKSNLTLEEEGTTMGPMKTINVPTRKIRLRGLEQSEKYTVKVNTVIRGKVLASRSEVIEAVLKQDGDTPNSLS